MHWIHSRDRTVLFYLLSLMHCLTVLTSLVSYKGTCSANFGTNFQCTYYCMKVAQDYQVTWLRSICIYTLSGNRHFRIVWKKKGEVNSFSALFQACPGRQLVFLVLSLLQHTWDTCHSSCGNNYQPPNRY